MPNNKPLLIDSHPFVRALAETLHSRPISSDELERLLVFYDMNDTHLELLKAQGYPLASKDNVFYLSTQSTLVHEQRFCFIDIETTGSKPNEGQIIEIGAIGYQHGEITGRFEEFVHAAFVPESITEITHITSIMLEDARRLKAVLEDLRVFLGDSVFVAHNVMFDYEFISHDMRSCGLGALLNPRLCTIDLAKKCILSSRYSLQYLNDLLGINTPIAHRAYADALTALRVFEISLLCLPKHVRTTQDLIAFSQNRL